MDKIGDLVVSLNAESHPGLADNECHWFVAEGLEWVIEHSDPSKNFTSFSKAFSWSGLRQMLKFLRAESFDQAIVFSSPMVCQLFFVARQGACQSRQVESVAFLCIF
jgi:ADP-heptose:LPS heptosyltransferase